MQAQVKLWQLLAAVISTIATMLTIVFMFVNRMEASAKVSENGAKIIENHEVRIGVLEDEQKQFKLEYKADIREIKASQEKILIILQNKQDRK